MSAPDNAGPADPVAVKTGIGKLSLVVFSGAFERVHYALVMAAAAVATNRPVTLFFTMGAARALTTEPGWRGLPTEAGAPAAALDLEFQARGVAGFDELLEACISLGATIMVCEMGLRALDIAPAALRSDIAIEQGGVVSFLADASNDGAMLFI